MEFQKKSFLWRTFEEIVLHQRPNYSNIDRVAAIVKWYNKAMVMLRSEFDSRWWQINQIEILVRRGFLFLFLVKNIRFSYDSYTIYHKA